MYDATFRIVIFGDFIVERKALTQRYLTNLFKSDQTMTIGVEHYVKSLSVDEHKVNRRKKIQKRKFIASIVDWSLLKKNNLLTRVKRNLKIHNYFWFIFNLLYILAYSSTHGTSNFFLSLIFFFFLKILLILFLSSHQFRFPFCSDFLFWFRRERRRYWLF